MAADTRPTELEHTILGVVFLEQPCTAYAVRKVFDRSLSAHWTSSAGSIYPAMRRLARAGYLKTQARPGDGRNTELYRLAAKGRRALRRWLSPPLPSGGELVAADPLRTRLRFLSAVSPDKALGFITEAREKLSALLTEVRREKGRARSEGDDFKALTHRAAELTLRAQLQWLNEAARYVAPLPG